MMAVAGYASLAWIPTFLIRTYGWSAAQAGLAFGAEVTLFNSLGILAGGWLCDSLVRRGYRDAHFRVGLIISVLIVLPTVFYPLMPSAQLALALLIPSTFLQPGTYGVAPAALQQVAPNEMRAQISAMYLFVVNLVGLGVGPTACRPRHGPRFSRRQHGALLAADCLHRRLSAFSTAVGAGPEALSSHRVRGLNRRAHFIRLNSSSWDRV